MGCQFGTTKSSCSRLVHIQRGDATSSLRHLAEIGSAMCSPPICMETTSSPWLGVAYDATKFALRKWETLGFGVKHAPRE